jgi:holo-[acyl-carrier protein] synthase
VTEGLPGIGLDLLEINRLAKALVRRPALADRLFTERERAYANARARPVQHLAARFCAKEAVAKALGVSHWEWQDVEVLSDGAAPAVALHGKLAERAAQLGVTGVRVSLTHSRGQAGAVAIIDR